MDKMIIKPNTAYIITDKTDRTYLSKVSVAEGVMVILSDNKFYFTDDRYYHAVKNKLKSNGITPKKYNGFDSVKETLIAYGVKTIYLNFDRVSAKEYFDYKNLGFEVLDCASELNLLRVIKSKKELSYIKKACKITQKAYHKVIKTIKIGESELDIKKRLEDTLFALGADGLAFDTIVAFGKNSAIPHHVSGKTKLKENSVILIDFGCTYFGYCADMTRTAFIGKPNKEFIFDYNAVLNANLKAEDEIVSGIDTVLADKIARDYLKEKKLDKFFTHSLGHGLGLEIHEEPYLSPKKSSVLKNGTVFSVEPGIYKVGKYGIRIEDTVVLENGKVKRLFTDSKKLKKIKIK